MCGIAATMKGGKEVALRMSNVLAHRGPDGSGVFEDGPIAIGHRLLSVMDVPELSAQPVVSKDKRFVLAYNGEIYNYRELRQELVRAGEKFMTDSDTEVLFKGLVRSGAAFLQSLDGMFALLFYDAKERTILLARDRFGMKPLYYAPVKGSFTVASELKALLAEGVPTRLDHEAFRVYRALGYVPGSRTLLLDVHKVAPGEMVTYSLESGSISRMFLDEDAPMSAVPTDEQDLVERVRTTIGGSVESHLIARRRVGLYLSGGMDSSIILHETAKRHSGPVRTYTTRFADAPERYNEDAEGAARLSDDYNIAHHEIIVTEQSFTEALEELAEIIEEPRGNYSLPAYVLLAREAAKDNTVMFSGDGGDEVFLGYPRYQHSAAMSERYRHLPAPLLNALYAFRNGSIDIAADLRNPLKRWMHLHGADKVAAYLSSLQFLPSSENDMELAIASLDRSLWLADEDFLRTDKIAMHVSTEGRFPFVSRSVVALSRGIGSQTLLAGGKKGLLRRAYAGVLPGYVTEKRKTGWNAPIPFWKNGRLDERVGDFLSEGFYKETADLFDLPRLQSAWMNRAGIESEKEALYRIMAVASFQAWAAHFKVSL